MHHAVDAAVIAALGADEGLTQQLTSIHQKLEGRGLYREVIDVPLPWSGFRADLKDALSGVAVSRPERRKNTGEAHEATIRRLRTRAGPDDEMERTIYERKSIDKVTKKDLAQLENPERLQDLISAVSDWLDQDKKTRPLYPRMPAGDGKDGPEIRKLRLPIVMTDGVEVREGLAGNGAMVRVDVFKDDRGFWMVPIYVHQMADTRKYPSPPMKACKSGTRPMSSANFQFSLYPWSFVRLVDRKGEITEGYYRKMNINGAAIEISPHDDASKLNKHGVKTLQVFQKLRVDLLGRISKADAEPRLWHGGECT